jgi:hypothetical protein
MLSDREENRLSTDLIDLNNLRSPLSEPDAALDSSFDNHPKKLNLLDKKKKKLH